MHTVQLSVLLALVSIGSVYGADPQDRPSGTGVTAETLAVIVNDDDPQSREVARYYQARRQIPAANMIHVRFEPGRTVMSPEHFQKIKVEVDRRTPQTVQAYALTWTVPYRVDCMSITTAFAAGFDQKFCSNTCSPTRPSPYFNSESRVPHTDFQLRPAMALAGVDTNQVKRLIDRGLTSDHTFPRGTGYLVSTSDATRNVRATLYPTILRSLDGKLHLQLVHTDAVRNRDDVLFYFTGATRVDGLDTMRFLPGAIADHLTSTGGQLTGNDQMSSLRWLEAGATGSYGTVVEPCNLPDKFPSPGVAMRHYLRGETLIEAYWKSVAMPGQGIFIGEPLARPFGSRAPAGDSR